MSVGIRSLMLALLLSAGLSAPVAAAAIGELFRFSETSSRSSGGVTATGDLALPSLLLRPAFRSAEDRSLFRRGIMI
jgi:hypothetical protein